MQLPAEQTSLEPRPRRRARDGPQAVREPEHPTEGATAADSRASPSPLSDPRMTHLRVSSNDLNKLPILRSADMASAELFKVQIARVCAEEAALR